MRRRYDATKPGRPAVKEPGFVESYLRCTAERNQTHTWKVALRGEKHANYFLNKVGPLGTFFFISGDIRAPKNGAIAGHILISDRNVFFREKKSTCRYLLP